MNTRKIATEYRLAQWAQLLQIRKTEGVSITEFCKTRGISRNKYFYWQRKVREVVCAQLEPSGHECRHPEPIGFTEVRVSGLATFPGSMRSEGIQMEYRGIQISVEGGYPPEMLATLIREVTRP